MIFQKILSGKICRKPHVLLIMLLLAAAVCLLAGCGNNNEYITSLDQLNRPGCRIGVAEDTDDSRIVAQRFPQAKIEYFKEDVSAYTALNSNKIDAFIYGGVSMETAIYNGQKGVRLLDESLGEGYTSAVAISPKTEIQDLEAKINRFLNELKSDGTLDDMKERWIVRHDEKMPDISVPKTSSRKLTVGTSGIYMPFTYYVGTELTGFDIELAYRFAAWLGVGIEFKVYDYGGIVAAALSGKVDCIFAGLFVTPERSKQITYSQPVFVDEMKVMVRDGGNASDTVGGTSFWDSIVSGFDKTFIRESRWKLFASGIGMTLLITVLSLIFGTFLGFFVFMLCRNGNPVANFITRFFVRLIRGMPVIVLLMILYYIIFSKIAIPGAAVAVICFTLVFASQVYEMIRTGVGAIDRGQLEAAYTLGYTDRRAFYRIILPQALPHIMPLFKASVTELIKATAVVGYITVQDLTKISDIIRSRTYEAFFPLIAAAVIYFLLAALLIFIVNRIELRIDPKKRTLQKIRKEIGAE